MMKSRNSKIRKVGIGFITGRKSFREVLTTYLKSWGDNILDVSETIELSLFVAYDLEYQNTQRKDYTNINIELREMLNEIVFIDRASIKSEIQFLTQNSILSNEETQLLFEKGYAGKRNAIMYSAAKRGINTLLFLDDDEYPLAVQKNSGIESWSGQQILSTHLTYIDKADITCGHHCGYISPIPNLKFNDVMSEDDFRIFIKAISNDVINWESMKELMLDGGITYADESIMSESAVEIMQQGKTKFITGSNLCINLNNKKNTSPFYNPPSARGEDTFLSTCLENDTVLSVPCYTFHDGFSVYTSLLQGVLPEKLKYITKDKKRITARFYNTCMGWIRYKPLFLYITQRESYQQLVDEIRENLNQTLPKLCEFFNEPKFVKIQDELNKYDQNVEKHFKAFSFNKQAWEKVMIYLEGL